MGINMGPVTDRNALVPPGEHQDLIQLSVVSNPTDPSCVGTLGALADSQDFPPMKTWELNVLNDDVKQPWLHPRNSEITETDVGEVADAANRHWLAFAKRAAEAATQMRDDLAALGYSLVGDRSLMLTTTGTWLYTFETTGPVSCDALGPDHPAVPVLRAFELATRIEKPEA